jgi:ubiquinone/menaquinone biosynthesis C-methylase UbiE
MNDKITDVVQKRYDRIAGAYDMMEIVAELSRYKKWRELLWSKVEGGKVLEVGVGTGRNFTYYPPNVEITAIDFSARMLARAKEKASKSGLKLRLQQMDVQHLEFEPDTFDTVVASFVFCSVPDPVRGLTEIRRVIKPGGKVLLLEHVLSQKRSVAWFMNLANPLVVRLMGANINRRTIENVKASGLSVEHVTDLSAGIFKLIEARKIASR